MYSAMHIDTRVCRVRKLVSGETTEVAIYEIAPGACRHLHLGPASCCFGEAQVEEEDSSIFDCGWSLMSHARPKGKYTSISFVRSFRFVYASGLDIMTDMRRISAVLSRS